MLRLYEKKYNPRTQIDEGLFNEFWDIFNQAANEGLRSAPVPLDNNIDADFINALKRNTGVFSAFKTHRFANDMATQMVGDDGALKPFTQWLRDTESIRKHHTQHWLDTEYNTAVRRAHLAAQWRQFEREKDILPNLEWIETTSLNPGEDHMPFWGVVLPVDDLFWDRHRPGDRWNCKCDLRNTDEPINMPPRTPEMNSPKNAPSSGLENNPGKDAMLFSPTHPYLARGHVNYNRLKTIVNRFVQKQVAKRNAEKAAKREARKQEVKQLRSELIGKTVQTNVSERNTSGIIRLNAYGLRNILHDSHSITMESKRVLAEIQSGRAMLGQPRFEPLNMERPNIQKKLDNGWTGVHVYNVSTFGKEWELKTAIIHNRYEVPYFIKEILR